MSGYDAGDDILKRSFVATSKMNQTVSLKQYTDFTQ